MGVMATIRCSDTGTHLSVSPIKNTVWVLLSNKIKPIFSKGIFDEFVKVNNFIVYLFTVMKVILVHISASILYMNVQETNGGVGKSNEFSYMAFVNDLAV